jgi:hypothetical protein
VRGRAAPALPSPTAPRAASLDEERVPHPDEGARVVVEELEDVRAGDAEDLAVGERLEGEPGRVRVRVRVGVGVRVGVRVRVSLVAPGR